MSSYGKLELNSQGAIYLRTERIDFTGGAHAYNLLYISDLHLGWQRSQRIVTQLIELAQIHRPDLILLGGDLVDRRRGLSLLSQMVQQLQSIAPTWAIAGNHDHWVGVQWVKQAVLAGDGAWLEGQSIAVPLADQCIQIDGGLLLKPLPQADYRILCAHNPIAMSQAQDYQLVLAGHLHGCQWVFWEQQGRLYPGAWWYRWNGLRFQQDQTTLLVSRGVGDTLPIRWNCPREVILCQIF
jgi:uncharacterized protein